MCAWRTALQLGPGADSRKKCKKKEIISFLSSWFIHEGSWLQGHFQKHHRQKWINYAEAVKKRSPWDTWSLFLSTVTQRRFLPSAMLMCSPAAKANGGYVYLAATPSHRSQAQQLWPQAPWLTTYQHSAGGRRHSHANRQLSLVPPSILDSSSHPSFKMRDLSAPAHVSAHATSIHQF